ncbi:MAG: hypothetical protein AAB695_00890 [Patescibacteria group bacterium]|mgnify:CR=1
MAKRKQPGSTGKGKFYRLVEKGKAYVDSKGKLIITDPKARTALKQIRGPIIHKKADVFHARPKRKAK